MDKNNKLVTIEGRKYKLIEGTQGDGRCFSASIYYSLFGHIAISDELNDWIQVNIINPIVKENNYDYRGDLFVWAFNLYSLNNVDSTNTNTNNTIVVDNLVEQLDNVFKLLTPLVMFKNKLKCQNENIVYENILYDITKLIDDVGYFNTHQPNNFTQEYIETAYNEIIKILNELVNYELEIIENFSDEILPVSEITNLSIDQVNDIIDKINNIQISRDELLLFFDNALANFKIIDDNSDVDMFEYFINNYKIKQLFHDPFHPTNLFFYEMFRQIIIKLDNYELKYEDYDFIDLLNDIEMTNWALPILPVVKDILDIKLGEYVYVFYPPEFADKKIYMNIYDYYYIRLSHENFKNYLENLK